jgi:hypothetical protein
LLGWTGFQATFGVAAGAGLFICKNALLLRQTVFQAALLRRVMRLTFSGCLIFHRQPETRLGDAKTVYAILR